MHQRQIDTPSPVHSKIGPVIRHISETVQDTRQVTAIDTQQVAYGPYIGSKIGDLESPWTAWWPTLIHRHHSRWKFDPCTVCDKNIARKICLSALYDLWWYSQRNMRGTYLTLDSEKLHCVAQHCATVVSNSRALRSKSRLTIIHMERKQTEESTRKSNWHMYKITVHAYRV